tara:strand:- start:5821 stop:6093 length:273 start_codon:yes stop_codon:yes gene_type:complete
MWVSTFSDLSLDMRQVVRMERIGHWRKAGKLTHGFHYMTLEEAKAANIPVKGLDKPYSHRTIYVYNADTLYEFFKDKVSSPRKLRSSSNW